MWRMSMKAVMDIRINIEVIDEKLDKVGNIIDLAAKGLCDNFKVNATVTAVNDYDEIISFDQDFSDEILHILCTK
jgi:hypothetical protein